MFLCRCRNDYTVYDAHMGISTCRGAYNHGFLVCIREVSDVKDMKIRVIKLPRFVGNILKRILRVRD